MFQNHTASDTQADGLTHSSIWCIVKDNQGTLWLGTYFGGVNYFNPEYEIYTRYSYSSNEKKGLSNPVVGRTIEDKDGNLWIGTEGGGLNYYNRRTREFKWYRPQEGRNSISHNNVKALYYDADKEIIWIGTIWAVSTNWIYVQGILPITVWKKVIRPLCRRTLSAISFPTKAC